MGLHYLRLRYIVVFHNCKAHYSVLNMQDGVGWGDTPMLQQLTAKLFKNEMNLRSLKMMFQNWNGKFL